MTIERLTTQSDYPHLDACDHLRVKVGNRSGKGLISRSDCSVVITEIADALNMPSEKVIDALAARARQSIPDPQTQVLALKLEIDQMTRLLRRASTHLTEITRMPNVEHVADEHNAVVREIQALVRDIACRQATEQGFHQ